MKRHLSILGLSLFIFAPLGFSAEPTPGVTPGWKALRVEGRVEWTESGSYEVRQWKEGRVQGGGGQVRTDKDSWCVLQNQDGLLIRLGPDSGLKMLQPHGAVLSEGRLLFHWPRDPASRDFRVDCGDGISLEGKGLLVEWTRSGGELDTAVREGSAVFKANGQATTVSAGFFASFRAGWLRLRRRLDRSEKERFDRWKILREEIRSKPAPKSSQKKKRK